MYAIFTELLEAETFQIGEMTSKVTQAQTDWC